MYHTPAAGTFLRIEVSASVAGSHRSRVWSKVTSIETWDQATRYVVFTDTRGQVMLQYAVTESIEVTNV